MNDKTITNIWTITIREKEVFKRVVDETLMTSYQRAPQNPKEDGNVMSDDDAAFFHRYYLNALSGLSMMLARRTARVGGAIDTDSEERETVYTLAMTDNHESELVHSLASHCLEYVVARVLEQWYGAGANFGSEYHAHEIRRVIHFRRHPIERGVSPLF